jgi:hypothetical protein
MLSIARTPLLLLASNEADRSGPLSNIVTTVFSSSVLAVDKRLLHVNTAVVTYILPTPQNPLPLGDAHHYSRINYGDATDERVCNTHVGMTDADNTLVGKLERKEPFGKLRRSDIKLDLKRHRVWCNGVDSVQLSQNSGLF